MKTIFIMSPKLLINAHPPVIRSNALMTNAVFRDKGIPKIRQTYHMKSAAVTDLKKVRIDSTTTNTP